MPGKFYEELGVFGQLEITHADFFGLPKAKRSFWPSRPEVYVFISFFADNAMPRSRLQNEVDGRMFVQRARMQIFWPGEAGGGGFVQQCQEERIFTEVKTFA